MSADFRLALYNWRMENELTQREAAERLGASHASINHWEAGKAYPRASVLAKVAPLIGFNQQEEAAPAETETTPDLELQALQAAQEYNRTEMPSQPVLTFRERMEARDRERLSEGYMARTREMVAARERPEPATGRGNHVEKLTRLAGFLEGLQAALKLDAQPQIDLIDEIIKEVKENGTDD